MHRGYLDQAIAFKREQSRENRSRGRRHTSQQDEWLERQRKEQREQSFSTYFNGANENKAAVDNAAQRRWDKRREGSGSVDGLEEGAELRRRGWRRPEKEITGKITQQSSPPQPLSPSNLPTSPTAAHSDPQPFASLSTSPPPVFSIAPSSSSAASLSSSVTSSPPARRRTWCRGSAVELRAEDGEVVRVEPRLLQWDVEANKGPATCRRRVEAELRGESVDEAEYDTSERKRASLPRSERNERAEAEEEGQTGEDTSAEVSYSGHAMTSDDNPGLSSRSSHSPCQPFVNPATSDAVGSRPTYTATAAMGSVRNGQFASPGASRGATPPLSPAPPPPRVPPQVKPLDFSSLFSSPAISPAHSPSAAPHPTNDECKDERKEADEDESHKRGTAWQISVELTAEEEQQMKQREDKEEKERQMAQQRREARAGRRAKRSTAPVASVSTATADPASTTAVAGRRSRPRRHTTTDASTSHSQAPAPVAPAAAAAAATSAAAAEVVSHSLDDLQRSWDDLDQFLATELASLSTTAATRKHTRLSVTQEAPAMAAAATPIKFASLDRDGEEEDVDAIIDDFLASDSTTLPSSRPAASSPSIVPLPVLPAGSELTLRVLSVWGGPTSAVTTATVSRVECYNNTGTLIHTVPLPASSSKQPLTTALSLSFPSRHRVSLIRLYNSPASLGGVREVELLLDNRLVFRGEVAADGCESILFTRDAALLGSILRTMHSASNKTAERRQEQRLAASHNAPVERDKRVVRVWRDGGEVMLTKPIAS